ncbi:MAG: Crp/Fnr family transcriptional regulator [Steroidobacter sp.]
MQVSKSIRPANRLLAFLPLKDRQKFLANCEKVELTYAQVLCESGQRVSHVYFPLNSFISLVTELDDGARLEVGIIGDEGLLGTSLILGVNTSSQHALVQGTGSALRISTSAFERHLRQSAELRQGLSRYVDVLMRQMALTAACTHYHLIEARLARWLLLTRDRAHSNQFHLTHDILAYMLGVRRVGITQAATALHKRGLINYSRGEIDILDSIGLEQAACCCYREAKDMYEQTLGSKLNMHEKESQ